MDSYNRAIFDALEDASLIRQTIDDALDSAGLLDMSRLPHSQVPSRVLYQLATAYIELYNTLVESKQVSAITENRTIH